jgi:hypothetical protein
MAARGYRAACHVGVVLVVSDESDGFFEKQASS